MQEPRNKIQVSRNKNLRLSIVNISSTKFIFCLCSLFFILFSFSQELKRAETITVKKELKLNYILQFPENYNPKDSLSLLIFLHGSGERGNNVALVKAHSPFTYRNLIPKNVVILAPQCPENSWWDTEIIYELIQKTIKENKIKSKKIYLTGLSMGGWGTWKLFFEHPEMFAAVAPVCAPADDWWVFSSNQNKISTVPIHIYHGALDDVVPAENSIKIYNELKKINPNVGLTIFPNDNHNSWDSTYSDPKFYQWLFSN